MSPRRAPGGPRSREAPGARQEAPKTTQEQDPRGPKPPRRLQEALREPILASSWGPRGLILEPSGRPFRASRAVC